MRLASLLVVGLALWAYLPPPGGAYWFDEVYTAHWATFRHPPGAYLRIWQEDPHPPLYYVLARLWAEGVGAMDPGGEGPPPGNEAKLRGFSSLIGVATVAYLALRVHPLAGLLLLASPAWAAKVAEARMYPLLGFLLAVSLVELLKGRPLLGGLAGLGALFTQYLAFFFVPFGLLLASLRRWWGGVYPYLPFAFWLPVVLYTSSGGTNAHLRPHPISNTAALGELATYPMGLALVALVAYAALRAALAGRRFEALGLLVPVLAVLLWWASGVLINTASPRYWGAFLPPLAASVGLSLRWVRLRLIPPLLAVVGLVGLLGWTWEVGLAPLAGNEGYREVASLAERVVEGQGGMVLLTNEEGRGMSLRYYIRDPRVEVVVPGKEAEGVPEEPWRGKYAGFYIFLPYIGQEGFPDLWEKVLALKGEGCWTRGFGHGSSIFFLVRCPDSPAPR